MPADVESAFTVRKPAWWDITGEFDHDRNPESIDEVLDWAGANWEPVPTPVFTGKESHYCESKDTCPNLAVSVVKFTQKGKVVESYACGTHTQRAAKAGFPVEPLAIKQQPAYRSVTRSDTKDVLAITNDTYGIFKNRETAELVEMLLDPSSLNGDTPQEIRNLNVHFETGGVLKGGKLVWFLARLDDPLEVPGDTSPIYPYVSVLNSHDGTAALRAIRSSIRIVCWNTWQAAEHEASKNDREFSFRHTQSIQDRVQEARNVLLGTRDSARKWVEYSTKMIAIPIDEAFEDRFLADFVPMPPGELITDRVEQNVLATRRQIKSYYRSASCASIAGTAYGLIQAVGEYLDHGRNYRTKETYLSRTMLKPEQGKTKAMQLVEQMLEPA